MKFRIKETQVKDYKISSSGNVEKYNKTVFQIQKFNIWFMSYELADYANYNSYKEALDAIYQIVKLNYTKKRAKYYYLGNLEYHEIN
jgi:hypothetical protein